MLAWRQAEKAHQPAGRIEPCDGRSIEAEIRAILEQAVRPKTRVKIGSELAAFGQRFRGVDLKVTRDQTPSDPAVFE